MATKGEYMTSGHFFCSCCNDVVNIRFTGSLAEQCPVCRNKSATWVEHLPRRNGAAVVRQHEEKHMNCPKCKIPTIALEQHEHRSGRHQRRGCTRCRAKFWVQVNYVPANDQPLAITIKHLAMAVS